MCCQAEALGGRNRAKLRRNGGAIIRTRNGRSRAVQTAEWRFYAKSVRWGYWRLWQVRVAAAHALAGDPLRLGVVWYLFPYEPPKEPGKGDGKFIDYLCHPTAKERKLIECDPFLYDKLHKIVIDEKDRRVVRVQEKESGILPTDTLYYDQCLSYEPGESGDTRKLRRAEWLNSALEATKEADLVFVDPDNGIAIPDNGGANQADGITKVDPYSKKGPKYVFMEDLNRFYCNGKSLVIYQHLTRQGKAPEQIARLSEKLQESLKLSHLPLGAVVSPWHGAGLLHCCSKTARTDHLGASARVSE